MAVSDKQNQTNGAPTGGQGKNGIVVEEDVREWLSRNYGFSENTEKPGLYSTSGRNGAGRLMLCHVRFDKAHPEGECLVKMGDELVYLKDLPPEDRPEPLIMFGLMMAERAARRSMAQKQPASHEDNVGKPTPPPAPPTGVAQAMKQSHDYYKEAAGGSTPATESTPPKPVVSQETKDAMGDCLRKMAEDTAEKFRQRAEASKAANQSAPTTPASQQKPASNQTPTANKFLSIAQKIKSVAEVDTNLSVLVYGRSGTGKTTFASTFPKPMLIVDIREKGTIGLKRVPGIEVLEVENWGEAQELIGFLKEGHKYQTIVVDTVTGLQDLATNELLRKNNMKPEDKITLPMHGVIGQMMIGVLMDLRDIAPHVVFLAQDKESKKDEDAKSTEQIEPSVGAELKDKVAKTLNRAVSLIVQTLIREELGHDREGKVVMHPAYRLRVGPDPTYTTKIRQEVGIQVPSDIEPSYKALMEIMTSKPMGE